MVVKFLQVVYGTTSSSAFNYTSTLADTNLTATITPSATTSKILVIVSQAWSSRKQMRVILVGLLEYLGVLLKLLLILVQVCTICI